jgi:prevent-host-death family protein
MRQQPKRHRSQTWPVRDARARLSELIDKAVSEGPQTVTKNGKPVAVLVSAEEWDKRRKPKGTLVNFFLNSPLRNSGLKVERFRDRPRKVDL